MGSRKRIHRSLLVGCLLLAALSIFAQAPTAAKKRQNRLLLSNFELADSAYYYAPKPIGMWANWIGVTDSFGVQRYMHADSLKLIMMIEEDPPVNNNVFIDSNVVCVIIEGDTTCVAFEQDSFYTTDTTLCIVTNGGDDTLCVEFIMEAGVVPTIYTADGTLLDPRDVDFAFNYLRFHQLGDDFIFFNANPGPTESCIRLDRQMAGENQGAIQLNNNAPGDVFIKYTIQGLGRRNAAGYDHQKNAFVISDSSNLENPALLVYNAGDSIVSKYDHQFDAKVLDSDGDAGSLNQVFTSTGTGLTNWAAAASIFSSLYTGDGTTPADVDVTITDNIDFGSCLFFIDKTNNRIGVNDCTPDRTVDILGYMDMSDAASNVFINGGVSGASNANNIVISTTSTGGDALSTGDHNFIIGSSIVASALTTGNNNIAIGQSASPFLTTGSMNIMMGLSAGQGVTTGDSNVIIGQGATLTGGSGGWSNNVIIGSGAGLGAAGSGNVWIGNSISAGANGNNMLRIDNAGGSTPLISGDFANDSLGVNGHFRAKHIRHLYRKETVSTSVTLAFTDVNCLVMTASGAKTVTLPNITNFGLHSGHWFKIVNNSSSGDITVQITGASSDVINGTLTIGPQESGIWEVADLNFWDNQN